jgi:hypothetical protein
MDIKSVVTKGVLYDLFSVMVGVLYVEAVAMGSNPGMNKV